MAEPPPNENWIFGQTEMARRIREFDWAATPLGPLSKWPHRLRAYVGLMLESPLPAYLVWGPEHISLYNDGYIPILGAKHPAGLGNSLRESWPEVWNQYRPILEAMLAGEAQHFVDRRSSWTPLRNEAGAVAGFYCSATEATAPAIVEAGVREADAASLAAKPALETIVEHVPAPMCLIRASDLRLRFVNSAYQAIAPVKETIGKTLNDVWPGAGREFSDLARSALETGHPQRFEGERNNFRPRVGAREKAAFTWSFDRVRIPGEDEWTILKIAQETTDGKRAEQHLKRVLETDAVGVLFFDYEGTVIDANEAFLGMTGYTRTDVEQRELTWRRLTPDEWIAAREEEIRRLRVTGSIGPYEKEYFRADGSRRWMLFSGRDRGDGTISAYCIDAAGREQAEGSLPESEARMAAGLAGMRRLHELHGRLSIEHDLHAALDEIVAAACEFTGTHRGCVQLAGPGGEHLPIVAYRGYGPDDRFVEYLRHEGLKAACDSAREHPQRLIIEDVANFPPLTGTKNREVALADGIRATQSTPMISHTGELIGVLSTQFSQPHRPSNDQLRFIDLVAWTAADFVERHRAEAALRESRAKLARELDDVRQLQRVSNLILQDEDCNSLYEELLDASIAIMRADSGSVQLTDAGCRKLHLAAWRNLHPDAVRFFEQVSLDTGTVCSSVLADVKRLVLPDLSQPNTPVGAEACRHYGLSGIGAIQSTPLVAHDGQLVGVISTCWSKSHAPEERQLRLLDVLARQAGDFIERRRAQEALRISEENYRTLFNSIDQAFCIIEVLFDGAGRPVDYRFLETNSAFARQTGIENSAGRTMREIAPEHEDFWFQLYGLIAETGESLRFEYEAAALGRYYDVYAFRIGEPGENRVAVLFKDILARKRMENAVRASEERLRLFLTASSEIVYRMSADWSEMYALEGKRFLADMKNPSQSWLEKYIPEGDRTFVRAAIASAIRTKSMFELEHRVIRAEGTVGWVSSRAIPFVDAHEEIVEWFGSATDITDRKRAETSLRASEARQAFLLQLSDALRPSADAGESQEAACRVLGEHLTADRVSYAEIVGDQHVVAREYRDPAIGSTPGRYSIGNFRKAEWSAFEAGQTVAFSDIQTEPGLTADEAEAYAKLGVRALLSVPLLKAGRLAVVLSVIRSRPGAWTPEEAALVEETAERTWAAVERARAETTLRQSEEKYRALFDSIDEGFYIAEVIQNAAGIVLDYCHLEVNRAFERMTGIRNGAGKLASELAPSLESYWLEAFDQALRTGETTRIEDFSRDFGRWYQAHISRIGGPGSRLVGVVFDEITERKRREANLAFLVAVSQDLAHLTNIDELMNRLGKTIGDFFDVKYCMFAEHADEFETSIAAYGWNAEGTPSLKGTYRMRDFLSGELKAQLMAGEPLVVGETQSDARVCAERYAALGIRSFIVIPLVRDREWRFQISIADSKPRNWRTDEIELMQELTTRIWMRLEQSRAEEALRESNALVRSLIDNLPGAAAFVVDHDLRYVLAGGEALVAAGFIAGEEFVGRCIDEALPPRLVAEYTPLYRQALAGLPFAYEHEVHGRVYLTRGTPLRNDAGDIYAALAVSYDITERRQAEEAFSESEERFRLLVENVHEYALIQTDQDGMVTSWNPGAERLFGYTSREMLGQDVSCLLLPEERNSGVLQLEIQQALLGKPQQDARWLMRKNHSRFWAQWLTELVRDEKGRIRGVAKVLRDETDRRRADQAIRASLNEKEELLKEVHHRVKNNLQVITSLLNLQAGQVEDERVLALFDEARNRVYSIAAIHELIYRSASFANIDMADYARQLIPSLLSFYGVEDFIRVRIEGQNATLELERAVPFGLLLNELASNVCKHAFPRRAAGELRIRIEQENNHANVEVADTGVGLPGGFDYRRSGSLGLQLVHSLARQLRATIDVMPGPGTRVIVRIPRNKEKEEQ